MAFDASKTLLLEKQYLYVRASKGFSLEGTSTERIWTNTGYYRFLVRNVAESLGNSYVTIHYDSNDSDFIAYCSDLFMEELQNSVTVAVENIESTVDEFASQNHEDIASFAGGVSGALQLIEANTRRFLDGFDYSSLVIIPHVTSSLTIINFEDYFSALEVGDSCYFYIKDSNAYDVVERVRTTVQGKAYLITNGSDYVIVNKPTSDNYFTSCSCGIIYKVIRVA